MTTALVILLQLLTPTPRASLKYAAWAVGETRTERRDLHRELHSIAIRESSLRPVRGHRNDRPHAPRMWRKAKAAGWVNPRCPESADAVRGILGLSAPYNFRWLGIDCAPAWLFDIPIVSAIAGARKHKAKCWQHVKVGPAHYIREVNPKGANRWCR